MRAEYMLGLLALHTKRWSIYLDSHVYMWSFGLYRAGKIRLEVLWTLSLGPLTITRALSPEEAEENHKRLSESYR